MEENPSQVGCELENLKEEIMQRDVHNSELCISLSHNEERFHMSEHENPITTITESYKPYSLAGGK